MRKATLQFPSIMRDSTERKYGCDNSSLNFLCTSGERNDAIDSHSTIQTYVTLLVWALPSLSMVDCFSFIRSQHPDINKLFMLFCQPDRSPYLSARISSHHRGIIPHEYVFSIRYLIDITVNVLATCLSDSLSRWYHHMVRQNDH